MMDELGDGRQEEDGIDDQCRPTDVPGTPHQERQRLDVTGPDAMGVAGPYAEFIAARRQDGELYDVLLHRQPPVAIALDLILIGDGVLPVEVQAGEMQRERQHVVPDHHLRGVQGRCPVQSRALAVGIIDTCQIDGGVETAAVGALGADGRESFRRSRQDVPVLQCQYGPLVEFRPSEAVLQVIVLHKRLPAGKVDGTDAVRGRNPYPAVPVLRDARGGIGRQPVFDSQFLQSLRRRRPEPDALATGNPQPSPAVLEQRAHACLFRKDVQSGKAGRMPHHQRSVIQEQ